MSETVARETPDMFAPFCPDCGQRMAFRPSREEGHEHLLAAECGCGFGIVGDDEGQIARAVRVLVGWKRRA